jgi:two-component sensor histidine kinase
MVGFGAGRPAWSFDRQTGSFLATNGLAVLYGYPSHQNLGLDAFLAAAHVDDRPLWAELFNGTVAPPTEQFYFRILRPDGDLRWMVSHIGTDGPGRLSGDVADVTTEREAADALALSEERFRFAIEAGRMAIWEVDMRSGRLTNSRELNLLLGLPVDAMPTLAEVRKLYAPGELERLADEGVTYERILDRVQPGRQNVRRDWGIPATDRTQVQAEFALVTPSGERKQLLLRAQRVPSVDGFGQRLTGVLVDITDRKLAEDRMALVAREMQHRIKNLIAVMSSIALQTFRPGSDTATAREAFSGRVRALDVALDSVLKPSAESGSLREIIAQIVAPYRVASAERFTLDGPEVHLSGRRATAVGMAIHELSTNALKYGALSTETGVVAITWQVVDGRVQIDWTETGGPPVHPPTAIGFGTRLLRSLLHDGEVTLTHLPTGVHCHFDFPLDGAL